MYEVKINGIKTDDAVQEIFLTFWTMQKQSGVKQFNLHEIFKLARTS